MTEPFEFPPEYQVVLNALDAEPPQVREMFHYALVLMMIDDEKAKIVGRRFAHGRKYLTAETISGERFEIVRPDLSPEVEKELRSQVQVIIDGD